jgi:hypothetical protein
MARSAGSAVYTIEVDHCQAAFETLKSRRTCFSYVRVSNNAERCDVSGAPTRRVCP